jgi:endonuclease/exonuclease/phosphatase family metal-dependent hydrolase
VKTVGSAAANFATMVPPVQGIAVERGWSAVDVKLHGRTVRVVNTHLEPFSPLVAAGQALELLAGPAGGSGSTIVLGDFNARPGAPAYNVLAGAGFVDVWPVVGEGAGLTCCHDDLTPAIPYDERIDLILVRGGISPISAEVFGDVPAGSFPFFPSDHAGVVATVEVD